MSDAPEQGIQQAVDQPTEPDTGAEKDWEAEAEKWKSLARKHEGNARTNADAAKRLAAIEEQNKTELERAVDKAAQEARAQYATVANARLIRSEVKAAAAALGFHDPADAAVQLRDSFGDIPVSEDGDVDEKAVKALIEKLASEKPYLVKTDNGKSQPLPGQGQHQKAPNSGREQGLAEARRRFPQKNPA